MSLTETILIAFGLAMDAFAVSIASGLSVKRVTPRHVFRIAFHFGLFQALMPIVGWYAGSTVAPYIEAWDHWIAFSLLAFVGGKMLLEARKKDDEASIMSDPTRGWALVILSIATSIDALAVGLTVAMLGVSIWIPALIIGIVAATLSSVGIVFGSRLGDKWGTGALVAGGLVLLAIGARILVTHLPA